MSAHQPTDDGLPSLLDRLKQYGTSGATSVEIREAIQERDAKIKRLQAALQAAVDHLAGPQGEIIGTYDVDLVEQMKTALGQD